MERHRTDLVSLFVGLFFAVSGVFALLDGIVLSPRQVAAFWPALLVLLGVWLLATTLQHRGSREAPTDPGSTQESTDTAPTQEHEGPASRGDSADTGAG